MMSCPHIRTLLLEAEPDELAGKGSSPVAEHVRSCPACAGMAERILDETARLDDFLGQSPPKTDMDALLVRAQAPRSRVIPFPTWKRWSAVAVAAAVTGLFFFRGDVPMQAGSTERVTDAPLVEAAPDQNVAVLATANPDITVLWFF